MTDVPYNRYRVLRLAGRCSNGFERGSGSRFHAVLGSQYAALCGAEPGRMSAGWSTHEGETVTCPRCLKKAIDRDLLPDERRAK